MELRMARWEVGLPSGVDGAGHEGFSPRFCGDEDEDAQLTWSQNGKQGEVKSVETLNQQAMAEHAGQSSQ